MNLSLDLSENATRSSILDALLDTLDRNGRAIVFELLDGEYLEKDHYHNLPEVLAAIDSSPVSDRVKDDAKTVYRILAEAEASVHDCAVNETHFHEVGNAEAMASILAICRAIELLDPDEIHATAVQIGSGTVVCSHGKMDIPAPATRAILERGIPRMSRRIQGERCTPTSAAVILHFVDTFNLGDQ